MAYELIRPGHQLPLEAATRILPRQPVRLVGTNRLQAAPCGTNGQQPFGMNGVATQGIASTLHGPVFGREEVFTVYEETNIVKAMACASLGAGAEVGVGSTNGRLIPMPAAASGVERWSVGRALTPAADGEVFSLYVKPRQQAANLIG